MWGKISGVCFTFSVVKSVYIKAYCIIIQVFFNLKHNVNQCFLYFWILLVNAEIGLESNFKGWPSLLINHCRVRIKNVVQSSIPIPDMTLCLDKGALGLLDLVLSECWRASCSFTKSSVESRRKVCLQL